MAIASEGISVVAGRGGKPRMIDVYADAEVSAVNACIVCCGWLGGRTKHETLSSQKEKEKMSNRTRIAKERCRDAMTEKRERSEREEIGKRKE